MFTQFRKMKLTLIFLACFVSLSYQQRWVSYPVPRELVYPGYFYQGNPYLQSFNTFASFNAEVSLMQSNEKLL